MVRKAGLAAGVSRVRLRTQVLVLQIVVVVLALGIAFAIFAYLSGQRLAAEYGQRGLAIARSVAAEPAVRDQVAKFAARTPVPGPELTAELEAGEVQRIAAAVQSSTEALFVVITDETGVRMAHPSRAMLGQTVSTDPSEVLAGHEVVAQQNGTLGESVRSKVPVREPGSDKVVGEVSVGISTAAVRRQFFADLRSAGLFTAVALVIGIIGSVLLARRWRGLTLGLEPDELADLVRGHEAVLHGIDEGVIGVDNDWRTTIANDLACELLGIDGTPGRRVDDIGLDPQMLEVFRAADATLVLGTVRDRPVVVMARRVTRGGRDLGAVLTIRDRTKVESLVRQLNALKSMSDVVRDQRHEITNRLQLVNTLVRGGRPDEAARYLDELLGSDPMGSTLAGIDTIADSYLRVFLSAKAESAREQGVTLRLGANNRISGTLADSVDVTAVLGNLINNAIAAAAGGAGEPRVVEVELIEDETTLYITVADSGDGVSGDLPDGLESSREVARNRGGDVWLSSPGNPDGRLRGAEYIATLPGVLLVQ